MKFFKKKKKIVIGVSENPEKVELGTYGLSLLLELNVTVGNVPPQIVQSPAALKEALKA